MVASSLTEEMMHKLDRNEEAQRKKEKITWVIIISRLNACSTCEFLLSLLFEVIQPTTYGAKDSLDTYAFQTSFLRACIKKNEEKEF